MAESLHTFLWKIFLLIRMSCIVKTGNGCRFKDYKNFRLEGSHRLYANIFHQDWFHRKYIKRKKNPFVFLRFDNWSFNIKINVITSIVLLVSNVDAAMWQVAVYSSNLGYFKKALFEQMLPRIFKVAHVINLTVPKAEEELVKSKVINCLMF